MSFDHNRPTAEQVHAYEKQIRETLLDWGLNPADWRFSVRYFDLMWVSHLETREVDPEHGRTYVTRLIKEDWPLTREFAAEQAESAARIYYRARGKES